MRKIVATAAAAGLLVVGATSAYAVSDGPGGFHPFTMDPSNGSCVPWTEPSGLATRNCDPINLIFPGRTASQVTSLLRTKGWTTSGSGSTQWLHFDVETTLVAQHVQLFRSDGFLRRYHIRLWERPGPVTVAGVHHERWWFGHVIDRSWDASEGFVRSQLCGACSSAPLAQQAAIQGNDGEWRGWANDANATVVP